MQVSISAVGRLRAGPEKLLVDDYLSRFSRTGRGVGLTFSSLTEVEDRKGGGSAGEARLLLGTVPDQTVLWILDERGERLDSPGFAQALARERDRGRGALAIMIGGADGLAPELRARADRAISLGAMVWPHMLVRVMLAEQLYRAASILAGTPYHRA